MLHALLVAASSISSLWHSLGKSKNYKAHTCWPYWKSQKEILMGYIHRLTTKFPCSFSAFWCYVHIPMYLSIEETIFKSPFSTIVTLLWIPASDSKWGPFNQILSFKEKEGIVWGQIRRVFWMFKDVYLLVVWLKIAVLEAVCRDAKSSCPAKNLTFFWWIYCHKQPKVWR
jgi:hypothetical protein